jgi:hypothetical protein
MPKSSHQHGEHDKRPTNSVRIMPSLSFSLMPHHVEAIRDAAIREQVSQSQIVRDALDHYFPTYVPISEEEPPPAPRAPVATVGLAQLIRELAVLRRELADMRQIVAGREHERDEPSDLSSTPRS